jgi:hypothetical protein
MIGRPNVSWRHARRSITITWEEGGHYNGQGTNVRPRRSASIGSHIRPRMKYGRCKERDTAEVEL